MRALMSSPFSLFFWLSPWAGIASWHCESWLGTAAGEGCWEEWLPFWGDHSSSCSGPDASPASSQSSCQGDPGETSIAHKSPPPTPTVLPPPSFFCSVPSLTPLPLWNFFSPQIKRVLMCCLPWNVSLSNKRHAPASGPCPCCSLLLERPFLKYLYCFIFHKECEVFFLKNVFL